MPVFTGIEYEDETGYQWRRTNTSQPKRIG